jgi:hypothetical protein
MTNEEAIDKLESIQSGYYVGTDADIALDMAIEAIKLQLGIQ